MKAIKERIENEDFPLDIKDLARLREFLNERILTELQESAKELNILFMIMKRELVPMLDTSGLIESSEDELRRALSIEQFIIKCGEDSLSEEELLKIPSEKERQVFILRDDVLKRFCKELKEKNSVKRFLEAKRDFLSLIEKLVSKIDG
ncbi:MAG: hypothetical protein N2257_00990 [Thermodesulfovibrionales bacterium]|nr:hypothetical protein [Thermodesulfovibrionales bacterium]